MKASALFVSALLVLGVTTRPLHAAEDLEKLKTRTNAAIESFKASDTSLPELFSKAAGYVVFPRVGKGGLVLGGAHGEGLVFEKGKLVGRASMSQATIGAQIGGQVFREVVVLEN